MHNFSGGIKVMTEEIMFTITVNSMDHNEWQGWVDFSASGERVPFRSLPELTKMVARKFPSKSVEKDKNNVLL